MTEQETIDEHEKADSLQRISGSNDMPDVECYVSNYREREVSVDANNY
tara:strand:- start:1336 stop:1479 length:144 start_codon:yes stop_codon:yes gene_type:complete